MHRGKRRYLQTDKHNHVAAATNGFKGLNIYRREHVHQFFVNRSLNNTTFIDSCCLAFYSDSILYFFSQIHDDFHIHIGLRPLRVYSFSHVK